MKNISRRDFLKFIATFPAGVALSEVISQLVTSKSNLSAPHIIIIVLDALTARNMSIYGYPRETTPNIERLAARSNVYHAHHSAGTFTTAGTASLLTGTYPWTHRAINLHGLVARDRYKHNIYNLLESRYNRIGFTQNRLANYLLSQFGESIEQHLPLKSFSQAEFYVADVEHSDHVARFRAFDNFLLTMDSSPGSLLFGTLDRYRKEISFQKIITDDLQYNWDDRDELIFNINHVFNGMATYMIDLDLPSFAYFHLLPPHAPYTPMKKFLNLFNDSWEPVAKPRHLLRASHTNEQLNAERLKYDQFIATTDAAFGRFLTEIEAAGLLDNSYLILTSDHGESFERGYLGHAGPFVYEPGVHIPLLISTPGQTTRRDFYSVTNSIDILPTLLKISDLDIPDWSEGELLPGFGGEPDSQRITFSMDIKRGSSFMDLSPITLAIYRGDYKLIYYTGYGGEDSPYHNGLSELYNLEDDPEELNDLINTETSIAQQMKDQLLEAYNSANGPV